MEDVEYEDSRFTLSGTDRFMTFTEIAEIAYQGANLPIDRSIEPGLEATAFFEPTDTNDPQAMHLATVMVDCESGQVTLRNYFTSDDCGRIINPMIIEGQVHGGLAQGIGQALMEHVIYDDNNDGQLLTGSFMDYAMPRASDMPESLELTFLEIPCPSNVLGVKGGSETGTIGPPAAIGNAVVDALWHLGVRHVEQPITAQRVWRAIQITKKFTGESQ